MKLNSKRTRCSRVIILQKNKTGSYGFTLQTYAFKNYKTSRAELLTYVDYVDMARPAYRAGMKRGDVILSINDKSIEGLQHDQLVQLIKQSPTPLRLTVAYEDWCTRIDLNIRRLALKQCLKEKYIELAKLERQEIELLRKAGQWTELSETQCFQPITLDQLSPTFTRRTSFMCTSLHHHLTNNHHHHHHHHHLLSSSSSPATEISDPILRKNRDKQQHNKTYECHSLPIVRKKKHFLQNQVFSVCENVVKMGCFSRSSVNIDSSSTDDATLDCDDRKFVTREQSKTWYEVPKMHRAALLKRQRKSGEATKWYFSVFDDDVFQGQLESEFDSSTSKSFDSLDDTCGSKHVRTTECSTPHHLLQSFFVPAETSPLNKVLLPTTFETLMSNLSDEDLEGRLQRLNTEQNDEAGSCSSRPDSFTCSKAFEDLSFESQEFMNSFPPTCSSSSVEHQMPCPRKIITRPDAHQSCKSKTQLTVHESKFFDTHL